MATFRSVLSRWIFAVAVFFVGFSSIGAASLTSPFQGPVDPVRFSLSVDPRIVSGPVGADPLSRCDAAVRHLKELVLTHCAVSMSA